MHDPLPDLRYKLLLFQEPGFPVFLDINLSEQEAQTWNTYLQEGLYIDQHTKQVSAQLMTYNAPLRVFGHFAIKFLFSEGGSIQVGLQAALQCRTRRDVHIRMRDLACLRLPCGGVRNVWIVCMHGQDAWAGSQGSEV